MGGFSVKELEVPEVIMSGLGLRNFIVRLGFCGKSVGIYLMGEQDAHWQHE